MGHTDAEYIWIFVVVFGLIGFITPFIALEFGGTVGNFDIDGVPEASGFGVLNAITSILFWTFGVPVWLNVAIFIPLRVMMWFIILRNTPIIGTGGS